MNRDSYLAAKAVRREATRAARGPLVSDEEFARRLRFAQGKDAEQADIALDVQHPDITVTELTGWDDTAWGLFASVAGLRVVPSQPVRDRVIKWRTEREAKATADPFAGLGGWAS